jgi:PAS domain S-box-containing protein
MADTLVGQECVISFDETDRLDALDRYAILDTEREAAFDDIVELAALIFEAPIAVVNLIADGRQWFKAEIGIGARELPLDVSICRHAILQRGVFVVPDLTTDPRFEQNPLVTAAGGLRFYAGALLETPEGLPLGTVCVLDNNPRPEGVTERQARALKALASQTMAQLETRRSQAQTCESESRLRFLNQLAEVTQPLTNADTVMAVTARLLAEHLNVAVCAYADMDEDQDGFTIRGDWAAPAATSIVGHYRLADFGALAVKNLGAGLPLVINDNARELPTEEAATFQNIGIAATICMPLVREGKLSALMAIHDRVPRTWTETEVSLLREVTARSWAHVERVAAVAELRASEGRLRAVFDQAAAGFARTDLTGRFVEVNDRYCTIVGRSREELLSLRMQDLTHPDDLTSNKPLFESVAVGGPPFEIEKRYLRPDGSMVWVRNSVSAVRSADNEIGGVLAVSIDLTQKRLAEAQLRESEARFRAIADASPALVWVNGTDGACEFVNAEYLRFFGKSMDEIAGFGWVPSAHPEDGEFYLSAYLAAVEARVPFQGQARFLNAAGEYRWLESTAAPRFGAGELYLGHVGLSLDITDRKIAEAALEESEARLRAVVDAAPVGLVFADAAGRITGGNARVEEILGRPVIYSAGIDQYGEYVAFHADGRRVEGGDYPLAKVIVGDAERSELEVQIELPDGSRRWVRYIATLVRNELGRTMGAVVASLDIDREKRFAESLAHEVEAAVAELEAAQEQLRQSQKLEAMGQLTGGVAHDFNNLLTPIIGSLDMLVRRGVGSERERRLIDGALQSAERAKTLVQRLLAFARRQPLQPISVKIPKLVESMVSLISSTLGPTIDVRVELAPELPPAKADPNQLEMALLNLAVNARDAMPGGGELTIRAKRETLRQPHSSGLVPGEYVLLCVVDTGTGMDEETLRRAIEPFFSTKGVGKGTGLGLSMVHGLAAQLGGGLTIESAPSKGTAIELWLPISTAPANEEERAAESTPQRVKRGVALLVDDEALVRMSTADMLTDLGFEVVEADTGEDALRLLRSSTSPDLLVTDHLMPGMTGVELAKEVLAIKPDLPVLVVSGYAEVDGIAPELPRLTKPFRNAELAASIAALLPNSL